MTDENGYFSSASSWNAHDSNTNANDWALTASDTIDSTKLNANAGFWFGNNSVLDGNGTTSTSDAVKADNKLGALPLTPIPSKSFAAPLMRAMRSSTRLLL